MSVSQRADGRFIVKYKQDGKWKQRAFNDETEARIFDANSAPIETQRITMGELVVSFLHAHPDMHIETKKRIAWIMADGGPGAFMRDKYADSLNRTDLEALREGFRVRGVCNNTINKGQAYLRSVLTYGVDQSFLTTNPWRDFKKLKITKYPMTATLEDLRKIYVELPDYMQWAVKTAFTLSLRFGQVELFNLEWSAFHWDRQLVVVRQGKSGRLKTVIMRNQAYIDEARERCAADTALGIPYVCHRRGKKTISYKECWNGACRRAGVQMRPYDIRHLSATTMLAAGGDLAAVAAQLGHSSVATTGQIYAHVTPLGQAHAAGLIPALDSK